MAFGKLKKNPNEHKMTEPSKKEPPWQEVRQCVLTDEQVRSGCGLSESYWDLAEWWWLCKEVCIFVDLLDDHQAGVKYNIGNVMVRRPETPVGR